MWKRDTGSDIEMTPTPEPERQAPTRETRPIETFHREDQVAPPAAGPVRIGRSVFVKGDLSASEDFQIDGTVEGTVDVTDHVLTIGESGVVRAEISARSVVVCGTVRGNILALERIDLREEGTIEGDVIAPRVAMAPGSHFRGSIDMHGGAAKASKSVSPPPRKGKAARTPVKAAAAG